MEHSSPSDLLLANVRTLRQEISRLESYRHELVCEIGETKQQAASDLKAEKFELAIGMAALSRRRDRTEEGYEENQRLRDRNELLSQQLRVQKEKFEQYLQAVQQKFDQHLIDCGERLEEERTRASGPAEPQYSRMAPACSALC